MPLLTPDLINNFPFYNYTDYKTIQRGKQYYRDGRVYGIEYHDDWALCEVEGINDDYVVRISAHDEKHINFSCTCPQAERAPICKHMVAALLTLEEYLQSEEIQNNWQFILNYALENAPRHKFGSNVQRYAATYLLGYNDYYYGPVFFLKPCIIKVNQWQPLKDIQNASPKQITQLLSTDHRWTRFADFPYQPANPHGCINLSADGIAFFNYVVEQSRYYNQFSRFTPYLPLLAKMDVPIFQLDQKGNIRDHLDILPDPVEIQAALAREGNHLTLHAGLELGGQTFTSAKENLLLVSDDPPWALIGNTLAPISNPESLSVLAALPLKIPAGEEETFREKYFRQIAEHVPIQGDVVTWEEVEAPAIPRLYLRDDEGVLRAEMRFGYREYEVPAEKNPESVSLIDLPGEWTMARVHRELDREAECYGLLTDASYRLKRAGRECPYGTFELRARAHPFDFLLYSVPLLTQAGFEIFGEENLKAGKVNRNTPTIRVNITSGIDWFDLQAVVAYGDQQVNLRDVRRALKKGEHFIKLADGSVGQIPEEWLEKYKHLWDLAEETEDGYRINDFHLPLVDTLLEDATQIQTPPDLVQRRERLRSFEQIVPKPLPQGFTGELRPYQKAGFDWLHFLREYKFGGILADDMGLGKTIQVLAHLQSRRKQAQVESASLLVVPKSLIVNWQREAERFTPELRFLEFVGNARDKDTATFDQYDVILTTYGTMLRDVDVLRQYRFDYVILDESQAIKNPLSQSAKATRLLQADHRLCMTGTPVENNTFELWSQFAFLNPGLLGSMDFFKKEFASPIESEDDEETARLLRALVYPFILRRTKEQVAPELPPRSERVLYTEMTSRQNKLYTKTRERYRAELLGLIDSSGMNDARMKILEGLLRLRQIAIHPALVEPTYRSEVPKFELLLENLETLQSEGHKALIFSQFVQVLHLIQHELEARHIPYVYLDGQTRDRQTPVDIFQNDPAIPFFLISLKAGGVGLNLTAADYVIHLDPWWNPAVEMQASDRAHRIGQDKPVFVYKLITRDTVEEKILQLQERKKALVENLITTESSFFKSLTADDVKVLFG
jgi:non-specific serine/threonine protein kinase